MARCRHLNSACPASGRRYVLGSACVVVASADNHHAVRDDYTDRDAVEPDDASPPKRSRPQVDRAARGCLDRLGVVSRSRGVFIQQGCSPRIGRIRVYGPVFSLLAVAIGHAEKATRAG